MRILLWLSVLVVPFGNLRAASPFLSSAIPQDFYELSGPGQAAPIALDVLSGTPEDVVLRFREPALSWSTLEMNGESFTRLALPAEGSQLHEGDPDLPRITRMVMIAPRGNVSLTIGESSYRMEYAEHPVAPKRSLDQESALDDVSFSNAYTQNQFWPPQVAEISEPMVFRDVRFVVLSIHPVQYNPVTGELRIHESIEIEIQDAGGVGTHERSFDPVSLTPGFRKLYGNFINFEHSPLDELPIVPGNQLFICQNNATVINKVTELATWRKKKGIDATVVTTTVAGSTPAAIRSYINTQYDASNGQLEFVTVVGDPDGSGAYYFPADALGGYPYGELDNYYGLMDNGPNPDPLPDIGIGRLPVADQPQLNAMVAKTIAYEANPFMADTTWYTRTWCAVHSGFIPSNPSTKEYTRQIMLQRGMSPGEMTDFPNAVIPAVLEQRVNQGVSVVNHRLSWGNSEMNPPDLNGLTNGAKLPFVAVITCGMGWYTLGESVTEAWVRRGTASTPLGAIGAMGMAGNSTRVAENNIVDGGAMMGLFARDIREQSLIMLNGKLELYRNFWDAVSQTSVEEFSAWCNLMGDAAVPIRIEVPQLITAVRPSSVNRYTNNVSVEVLQSGQPVEGALVGLYQTPGVFARGYTDANGEINLAAPMTTLGWVYLTITGTGLKPILDSIQVVDASATLALNSVVVDDDNLGGTVGNGDGILNPGEIVDLNISLINRGTSATATSVSGNLVSDDAALSVTGASGSYPNIAINNSASPSPLFRVEVGAVRDAETSPLFLTATSSAGTQIIRVDLPTSAGAATILSANYLEGDLQLDPGDSGPYSLTIQNDGSVSMNNVTGILRSLTPYITVTDSLGSFGSIAVGTNAENSANTFGVTAGLNSFGGLSAALELVISDASGFRDSVEFVQMIGTSASTSPTGPDAYGYFAYDNTELEPAGSASQYDWFDISTIGTDFGFDDQAEDADDAAAIELPFDFTFYGLSFDSLTVCTNGWVAFGDHSNMWDFRNWRIGSPLGPPNMIAAYWDDLATTGGGVYSYYDAAEQRFIVQWDVQTLWTGVPQSFQVVLYNPNVYPTPSGDGKILVQYSDVTPNANSGAHDMPWATLGIQNADHTLGLEYYHSNVYSPGAATLTAGRSIMYTTAPSGTLLSSLTVLSPNGGEALFVDSSAVLSWYQGTSSGTVRIELSRNGVTGPWTSLSANAPNTGSFAWTVNGPSSNTCYLRVISNSDPDEADTCDASFTIGTATFLLDETFDGGAPGWSNESAGGSWISQWHLSTERAQSGTTSYKCGDMGTGNYSPSNDAFLISPVMSDLPQGAVLRFAQQYVTEISGAFPDSAYDGCVLEYSLNGGAWSELLPTGGYTKAFRYSAGGGNPATGPMPGRRCFGGTQDTWSTVTADLGAFAGADLRLRFRFGSDLVNEFEGWYVDDVQVFAPAVSLPAPSALLITVTGNDVTLRWDDAGYSLYRIYSSTVSDDSYETFEGSTSGTSFTIVNGVSDPFKVYVVTGE